MQFLLNSGARIPRYSVAGLAQNDLILYFIEIIATRGGFTQSFFCI